MTVTSKKYQIPHISNEVISIGSGKAVFEPALELGCFLGESKLTLLPQVSAVTELVKPSEVEAENSDIKFLWKPTGIAQGFNERGGIDTFITLLRKPDKNYIDFGYDVVRLAGYHQSELTAQEISEECERPDHVINSIAWYHDSKGGVVAPADKSKFITTGKAGHTYRMMVQDAIGNKAWTNWTLEAGGVARLWIDNTWLKNATYPVVISPVGDTFGYTSIGGSNANYGADRIRACQKTYSPSSDGTLDTIHFYTYDSGDNVEGILYDSSENLIDYATGIDAGASPSWKSGSFNSGANIYSATAYYLAFNRENANHPYYDNLGAEYDEQYRNISYGTYPDPASFSTDIFTHREYSIYITYTAGGGGTTHYGTATLTGAGDLAGVASMLLSGIAALAGSGSLSAAGKRLYSAAVTLTGAGDLAAAGKRIYKAAGQLTGAGSLSAAGKRIYKATAALAGVGLLSAAGDILGVIKYASATLTGAGSLSAAAGMLLSGAVSLTGAGNLVASAHRLLGGKVTFTGSGTLSAIGGLAGAIVRLAVDAISNLNLRTSIARNLNLKASIDTGLRIIAKLRGGD